MSLSLNTAVTGLRAHQLQLDVVANNLANLNTIGFKSQFTTFRDNVLNLIKSGSGSSENSGGTNGQQIGTGVEVGQTKRNFAQGALQSTGELLDFGIQGEGFFVLRNSASEPVYTRAGSFALNSEGHLFDPASGNLVQRIGDTGEFTEEAFGFQTAEDSRIRIPLGAPVPGRGTADINFFGNLPSTASPPLAEVLNSSSPFLTSGAAATGTTLLNDLDLNTTDYQAGDQIRVSGTDPSGTAFDVVFTAFNATMQDLVDEISTAITGATASLGADGTLVVTADATGDAFTSMIIQDEPTNTGQTSFSSNNMVVATEGSDGDRFETQLEVFDERGQAHLVSFTYQKLGANTWQVEAELLDGSGTMIDSQVGNLTFNEDGTYATAGSSGNLDTNIEFDFDSFTQNLDVDLDLSNLTHFASEFAVSFDQDGAPPGALVSATVSGDGRLEGLASNGDSIPLAQLAIARFSNPAGLDGIGGNFYVASRASGEAFIGRGESDGRGQVVGSQLENSNVDIAQEFTRLIVAQRGFAANARTISVADEVLEEITNIVR